MPCYQPMPAFRREDGSVTFAERGRIYSDLTLACGQCIGCRLERSRQWAIRCMHEAKMHRHNCFITLTYNNENNPGTLVHRDIQLFNKRLLKALGKGGDTIHHSPSCLSTRRSRYGASPHTPVKTFRYYMAGEYGAQLGRPHYHLCIFGIDFADKKYLCKSPAGEKLYRSDTLEKLWTKGFSSIGNITFESAAYVARYVMKKINGDRAKKHYEKINTETGEITNIKPEYNQMSRGQGIGKAWLQKYTADVYPHATVIVRGKPSNTPRYYDKQYKKSNPTEWEAIEYDRHIEGKKHWQDQTDERLAVRQTVAEAKIKLLKRKI